MLRDWLIGDEIIDSRTEYKYSMLRAQLALLLAAICIIYVFIDTFSGVYVYLPWYAAGVILSLFVILTNRQKRYLIASILLLFTANMLVLLFASIEATEGGAFFYFIATAATGIVVFIPINKKLGLLSVGISIALAAWAYFGEGLPIDAPVGNASYEMISFGTNFLIGLLSCVLILIFVVNRNEESEDSLLKNQDKLKNLTKELEKSKNRFSRAVDGTKAGIYEWNLQSSKTYVSARYMELLGFEAHEEYDMSLDILRSFIHPADIENYLNKINSAIEANEDYQIELRLRKQDGNYRWFLDSGIINCDTNETPVAVGSIIDINDRKVAEQQLTDKNEELEKANKELDRFVYSASHDMRAPLTTLLGLINLARLSNDFDELREYHKMMSNRIQTMEGFIREVTDYSRNSRLEVQWVRFDFSDLMIEIMENLEFSANKAGVKLDFPVDVRNEIYCDRQRLKVILNNLIENAIKYHDVNKTSRFVRVKLESQPGQFIIRISDNGIGIKSEYQDKIYNMFFRATERSDGSGLGLYIVKETLEKLNGTILLYSDEGIGSKFELKIPQAREIYLPSEKTTRAS